MSPRFAACAALLLFVSAAYGCELQALYESALHCSMNGKQFNITKYEVYITTLINDAEQMNITDQNIGDFFAKHSFASMAEVFGEVEPAIVWMMDSFYKEHLKDRTEDTFIRPMFGDMSKMAELLTSSLTSHCLIVDELITCMNSQLLTRCSKRADATRMNTMFMQPLQQVFCDASTYKSSAQQWLIDHSAGLTSAFSCVVDQDPTKKDLTFRNFSFDPVIMSMDFGQLIRKCNAEAIGPGFEEWLHTTNLLELFEDFNMTTFNIFDLIDMNIPRKALRVLRPMADCFIQELLPFAEDLCPTVDVTGQINSMMDVFKFLLPLFEDDQDRVRDMLLNPMQRPNLASSNRFALAMVGGSHIYNFKTKKWVDSCADTEKSLLFAVNGVTVYAVSDSGVLIDIAGTHLQFKKGGDFYYINEYLSFANQQFTTAEQFYDKATEIGISPEFLPIIYTDAATFFDINFFPYGVYIKLSNPNKENWAVIVRAGSGLFNLAHGALVDGCRMSVKETVSQEAATAAAACATECADLGEMIDPCKYDCLKKVNSFSEHLTVLSNFEKEMKPYDEVATYHATNVDSTKDYAPCSMSGFVDNVASYCASITMLYGAFPQFGEDDSIPTIISKIGVFEPSALMAIVGIAKQYSVGTTVRNFFGEMIDEASFNQFISKNHLNDVVGQHCRFAKPMVRCLEHRMPDYCSRTSDEFLNIVTTLKGRYCSNMDTATPIAKQSAVDELMEATTNILPELSCFLDANNQIDMTKVEPFYKEVLAACQLGGIVEEFSKIFEEKKGEMLNIIKRLVRIAKNPLRCAVKVIPRHCPNVNVDTLVDKLLVHINRATMGVFEDINKDYFINPLKVNFGSSKRVTMMAVGDPHLRALGDDTFTLCDAPGYSSYFASTQGLRVELYGMNTMANENSVATMITNVSLQVWAADAAYDAQPVLKYEAADGNLPTTFTNGQTEFLVEGTNFSLYIEPKNPKTIFLQNPVTGALLIVNKFKNFYNLILRTSQSYAESGTGLFVDGCGEKARNVTAEVGLLASTSANARKKRAVTIEQCQETCVTVKEQLQQECIYDCDVLEDPEVADAHTSAVEVEVEAEEEDVKIAMWLPDLDVVPTEIPESSSAAAVILSTCLFTLTAVVLLQ